MRKLIVANWKMNPSTEAEAKNLFEAVKKKVVKLKNVETVFAPPYVFLTLLTESYKGNKIGFAGQDIFWEQVGSYTGEVSPPQLKSAGAEYCIVGHSERRLLGETDEMVNKKVRALLSEKITAILCIGEKERDGDGSYLSFVRDQIVKGLKGVEANKLKHLVIAYEPIWAIGKSADEAMKPSDMHEMKLFIQKVLLELYEKSAACRIPVLYGGSVEPENAGVILEDGEVDGFLVGHASLVAEDFSAILGIAEKS